MNYPLNKLEVQMNVKFPKLLRRTHLPLVLVILAALLVTTGSIAAQSPVTISIAFWGNNEEANTTEQMIAAFEAANPNIKVDENWVQGSYEEKVTTMIAGGTPPDLWQISQSDLPGFVDAFAPVTGVDTSAYSSPTFTNALTYDGSLYAIPFVAKPKVMGINVDLFKAAGIPIPSLTDRMTTDQFQDLAVKLSSGDGDKRVFGSAPLWFGGWLYIFGNTFYGPDFKSVTVGDQSAIDAANFVINSSGKLHYAPTAVEATGQDMFSWFLSGKVAMYPDFGPWYLPLVKPVTDMNWELVPDPGKGEQLEIDGFGISNQSQHPDEAKALALFLSQNEQAQEILGSSSAAVGVPIVQKAADLFAQSIPNHNINAFVLAAADSPIEYGNKISGQLQDTFNHEINSRTALGTGSEDPAVVFPEVAKELNAMFNQ